MKNYRLIFVVLIYFFVGIVSLEAQKNTKTISPSEAQNYVGQNVIVKGYVAQVSKSKGGNVFLNFEKKYPNQIFTAVVFKKNANKFSNIEKYQGKTVEVSGFIQVYKGKPQIVLEEPSQIKISK